MGGQSRWLAICSNAACGHVETHSVDASTPSGGLQAFLLGARPTQTYVVPWVRFFVQVQCSGVLGPRPGFLVSTAAVRS